MEHLFIKMKSLKLKEKASIESPNIPLLFSLFQPNPLERLEISN